MKNKKALMDIWNEACKDDTALDKCIKEDNPEYFNDEELPPNIQKKKKRKAWKVE